MRSRWLAEATPSVLGGIAEAAWIAIFAAAIGEPKIGAGPAGSLPAIVVAALFGVAAGRLVPFRRVRPVAIFSLAVLAVLVGMALSRGAGLGPTTARTLAIELLLGLAVLRGAAHGDPDGTEATIDRLVLVSPVLIGAGWLVGLTAAGNARSEFATRAFDATILFIVAATLGLGSARVQALAGEVRRAGAYRAWLVLASVVVGSVVLVGLPVAALLGVPVAEGITTVVIGIPLAVGGTIVGIVGAAAAIVASLLTSLLGPMTLLPSPITIGTPPAVPPEPPRPGGGTSETALVELLMSILLWALPIVLAWYLAFRWRGRRRVERSIGDVVERRSIDLDLSIGLPALRIPARLRMLRSPRSALVAYPRLLDDWSAPHPLARGSSETPAGHARRLRSEGHGDLGLELLVADYELARFGAVRLTEREERRAVARWQRLRRKVLGE